MAVAWAADHAPRSIVIIEEFDDGSTKASFSGASGIESGAMTIDTVDMIGLRVLAAILGTRHVGRAAEALKVGQPTVSYHLRRLRALFGDPLVVRDARGVRPTARALRLLPRVTALLAAADALVAPETFDPARARREVRIASLDYERVILLAGVVARIAQVAPDVRVSLIPRTPRDLDALAEGELDLVVGPRNDRVGAGYLRRVLYEDEVTCGVAAGHPLAKRRRAPALSDYVAYPHVSIIVEGTSGNEVDLFLARRGLSRRTIARVAGFDAACAIVAQTNALVLLPASLAARARTLGLTVLRAPLTPRTFGVYVTWHEAVHHDPLHTWLRALVVDAGRALRRERAASRSCTGATRPSSWYTTQGSNAR
jgi:DNA-binding transcriptional LysR family regulator